MSSTSKVKNISQAASTVTFSDSSSVSSAADAEVFSDLFDKMQIQDMQNGKDAASGQSEQQNQNDKAASKKEVKQEQNGDVKSAAESQNDASNREISAEDAAAERQLEAQEKDRIAEMENYRISIEELTKQLNVAMAATQAPTRHEVQVKIVVKGPDVSDLKQALSAIDPKLLRKVDIKALDEQLSKLMAGEDLLSVAVPREESTDDAAAFSEIMARMDINSQPETLDPELIQEVPEQAVFQSETLDAQDLSVADALAALREQNRARSADFSDKNVTAKLRDQDTFSAASERRDDVSRNEANLALASGEGAASQKSAFAGDAVAERLKALSALGRFDLRETISDSKFVFAAGAPDPIGANTPTVTTDLFLSGVAAAQASGGSSGSMPLAPTGGKVLGVGALDAGDLAKIKGKVESVVLEMAKGGEDGVTRIRMHPETLGSIDIKISMKEKSVRAEIVTDKADTKEIILQHLPRIREVLASENLMLDHFSARHDGTQFGSASHQNASQSGSFWNDGTEGRRPGEHARTPSGVAMAGSVAGKPLTPRHENRDGLVSITV